MSESNDEKPHGEEQADDQVEETNTNDNTDSSSSETDWRAEARKWEKRAKQNYEAAKQLEEIEQSKKSDLEKLAEARDEARADAQKAKAEFARLRVALKKGLTESQAKRLVGETEEDLEADADELLTAFSNTNKEADEDEDKASMPKKPRERLPSSEPSKTENDTESPSKLADLITKRARGHG